MNDETTGGATGALLESDIPVAHVRTSQGPRSSSRRSSRFWFVTAACLFIAAGLVIYSLITTGLNITIRFDNGHGIQPGDAVRFRGIDIGKVLTVELNEQLDVVTVRDLSKALPFAFQMAMRTLAVRSALRAIQLSAKPSPTVHKFGANERALAGLFTKSNGRAAAFANCERHSSSKTKLFGLIFTRVASLHFTSVDRWSSA